MNGRVICNNTNHSEFPIFTSPAAFSGWPTSAIYIEESHPTQIIRLSNDVRATHWIG
jgi:hypothetical protein